MGETAAEQKQWGKAAEEAAWGKAALQKLSRSNGGKREQQKQKLSREASRRGESSAEAKQKQWGKAADAAGMGES